MTSPSPVRPAPHGCSVDSRGDLYVAEVSYTALGKDLKPPREIRSLQKFALVER